MSSLYLTIYTMLHVGVLRHFWCQYKIYYPDAKVLNYRHSAHTRMHMPIKITEIDNFAKCQTEKKIFSGKSVIKLGEKKKERTVCRGCLFQIDKEVKHYLPTLSVLVNIHLYGGEVICLLLIHKT